MRKIPVLAALVLALSLALGACGSDNTPQASTEAGSTGHNDADVTFASEMMQHHAQALTMVDLTTDRPLDPEVRRLADQIKAAQGPEITTMTGWLTDWDEPVPDTSGDMGAMEMDSGMPGMMSADEMSSLAAATDAEFQDQWLMMMTKHHEGAVEMAQSEESDGRYGPAIELAKSIRESQTTEIATMKDLLG